MSFRLQRMGPPFTEYNVVWAELRGQEAGVGGQYAMSIMVWEKQGDISL